MLEVTIFNPQRIVFKGQAKSVILPGETGTFEVLPFHKRMVSRLIGGNIEIDGSVLPILRGIARVDANRLIVVAEEPSEPSKTDHS